MSNSPEHPQKPKLDRAAQQMIGNQLRAMYSELVKQPLPEKLVSMLRSIQVAETMPEPEQTLQRAA